MQDGTTKVAGVVLPSSPVGRERGTVMDLLMEVNMTAMPAARETSCVAVTTARSLAISTTRRTTAVRNRNINLVHQSKINTENPTQGSYN